MRIIVNMLLYLECTTLFLHLDAEKYVEVHLLSSCLLVITTIHVELRIVSVLHVLTLMLSIVLLVDAQLIELLVHILRHEVLTGKVNHRTSITSLIHDEEARNTSILGNLGVISTKGGSNVYDTSTILCGNVVTRDYTESIILLNNGLAVLYCTRLHPGHQLLVLDTYEVRTLTLPNDFKFSALFCLEVRRQEILSYYIYGLLIGVGILTLNSHIVNLRTYAKCSI